MSPNSTHKPPVKATAPRWSRRLLAWSQPLEDRRFVLADLDEEFERRCRRDSARSAARWYRQQALRSLGHGLRARVVWRRMRGFERTTATASRSGTTLVERVGTDLRLAARGMVRKPLFAIAVTLSLGLGLGAVTAALTLVHSLLFQQPVGLQEPERLVALYTAEPGEKTYGTTSHADFLDLRRELNTVDDLTALKLQPVALEHGGVNNVLAEVVASNYFEVTGLRAQIGNVLPPSGGRVDGADPVVVLGHDLWSLQFGSQEDVIGSVVKVDGQPMTVVGVVPEGVVSRRAPIRPDLWVSFGALEAGGGSTGLEPANRDRRELLMIGRLSSTAQLIDLERELQPFNVAMAREHAAWRPQRGAADDLRREIVALDERSSRLNPHARTLLGAVSIFLVGSTLLVLLVACTNVGGLLLSHLARRRGELALRNSLGASRGRVVSMLMVEGVVPALGGALVALGVARLLAWKMQSLNLPTAFPIRLGVELNGAVVAVNFALAALAWIGFSLLPAWNATRSSVASTLRTRSGGGRGQSRTRALLVAAQCAASALLLVGAGLFLRSLDHATEVDLGLQPKGVAVASMRLPSDLDAAGAEGELQRIADRLLAQPGIDEVAYTAGLELTITQGARPTQVRVAGYEPSPADSPVWGNSASAGYQELLRMPLKSGRFLRQSDRHDTLPVAVINESFAQRFWPGEEALGRSFQIGSTETPVTIVGVTREGKYLDFDDAPTPYFWAPLAQSFHQDVVVAVRGSRSATELVPVLERELPKNPGQPQRLLPSTYEEQLSVQYVHLRLASTMLLASGAFGLFLALIGIYGLVALAADRRRREMSIRLAIGAPRSQVLELVLFDGLRSAAVGVALGLALALPAARLLRGVLSGVSPADPWSYGGAALVLIGTAFAASLVPALRLSTMSPVESLRGAD